MAELSYILKQDIEALILDDTLTQMTGGRKAIGAAAAVDGDDSVFENLIPKAMERVKGYSRHWYDMETEMRPFYSYDVAVANTEDQRVASAAVDEVRTLYLCIQDAPAGTLLTNTEYFTPADDRNQVVVELVVNIIIYHLARRLNPRQIPEQRQIDFDRTIDDLKDIQRGRIQLEIAERTLTEAEAADDAGEQFNYGDFDDVTQDVY